MTDLATAVGHDLTETLLGGTPPGAGLTVRENIDVMVAAHGSQRAVARHMGIAESTLRSWRKGSKPRRGALFVAQSARMTALDKGKYMNAYSGKTELEIVGEFTFSSDTRTRTIYPGRYIPRSEMKKALTLWIDCRDDEFNTRLLELIDTYYQPLRFDRILSARFR